MNDSLINRLLTLTALIVVFALWMIDSLVFWIAWNHFVAVVLPTKEIAFFSAAAASALIASVVKGFAFRRRRGDDGLACGCVHRGNSCEAGE